MPRFDTSSPLPASPLPASPLPVSPPPGYPLSAFPLPSSPPSTFAGSFQAAAVLGATLGILMAAPGAVAPAHAVNPQDISVLANLQVQTDFKTPGPLADRLYLNELELSYQGYLSPFARADLFLGFHPDQADPTHFGIEPEEAYITLLDLPFDSSLRLGKLYASFGKLNRFHGDQFFTVDRPLVLDRFLGEEGLADFGAEVSLRVPNPFDAFVQLNAALLNSGSALSTPGAGAIGKAGSFRLSGSVDVGDEAYLEAGLSGLAGPATQSAGIGFNAVGAADVTFRWRPDETTGFTASGEFLAHRRLSEDGSTGLPTGFYALADYRFWRHHDVGVRLDQTWNLEPADRFEQAASIFYTFTPWETSYFRLQATYALTHERGPGTGGAGDVRLLGQTVWFLGPHKHAVQF